MKDVETMIGEWQITSGAQLSLPQFQELRQLILTAQKDATAPYLSYMRALIARCEEMNGVSCCKNCGLDLHDLSTEVDGDGL